MEFKELFENFSQAGEVVSIGLRTHQLGPIRKCRWSTCNKRSRPWWWPV